jgi:hypothetical protein
MNFQWNQALKARNKLAETVVARPRSEKA